VSFFLIYHKFQSDLYFLFPANSFKIAIVKSKQDSSITKKLIAERQLEKSAFRFKRFFLAAAGGYYDLDKDATAYTHAMEESKYQHVFYQ
jgi:hypothetical protein